jgi:hypothetical protein
MQTNGPAELAESLGVVWADEHLAKVRSALEGVGSLDADLIARLQEQFPGESDADHSGIPVFRDLLRIEGRRPRFRRLLRVWAGKLTSAIRAGDLERAEAWMRALVKQPTYPAEFSDLVEQTLDEISRRQVLDDFMVTLASDEEPTAGAGLVAAWGERMARYLVDAMAREVPPVNRRYLVEALGWLGREDVRLLAAMVADPRWYIARNLAIALGKTGRPQASVALEALLDHPDDRVRVEALRAMASLRKDESLPSLVAALGDASGRVRHAAVSLLRASPSPRVIPLLVDVLSSNAVSVDEAERLVEVIAERNDPSVPDVLQGLAGRRFAMGMTRIVRDAAREALEAKEAREALEARR